MDRLLGHLAQFGAFSRQGELLCTQGLAYLLRDAEAERVFTGWISTVTHQSLTPALRWQAERRQEDGGRPDLEGRNAENQSVVKIEAKLRAPLRQVQLESYVSALFASGGGGTFLVVVPQSRLDEATRHVSAHFGVCGAGPWRITREAVAIPCSVATWESLVAAFSEVASEQFRDELSQFRAMYRVLNGDDMEPLTSDEQVLAWRDREAWWDALVEHATRALSAPDKSPLPHRNLPDAHSPYRARYVCRPWRQNDSCYSVGTRDPFQTHQTPIWLRFHKDTADFANIASRLDRSAVGAAAVRDQGHLWFPLKVPLNADRETMTDALIAQVQKIATVAYPPAASLAPHANPQACKKP